MPRIVWQGSLQGSTYRVVVLTTKNYVIERLRFDAMREPRWETEPDDPAVITTALWSLYQDALNKKGITQ